MVCKMRTRAKRVLIYQVARSDTTSQSSNAQCVESADK